MNCELWQDKMDSFVDSELTPELAEGFQEHVRECPACAAETIARQQLKAQTHIAGQRFAPSHSFRREMERRFGRRARSPQRSWIAAGAAAAAVAAALVFLVARRPATEMRYLAQLRDAYLATQSGNAALETFAAPESQVKSWFAGKVPFTVDVPALGKTAFSLRGGQVVYLDGAPAAELVFAAHRRQISVFIFRERPETLGFGERDTPVKRAGLEVESWTEDGLRYLAMGEDNPEDIWRLCGLLKAADAS